MCVCGERQKKNLSPLKRAGEPSPRRVWGWRVCAWREGRGGRLSACTPPGRPPPPVPQPPPPLLHRTCVAAPPLLLPSYLTLSPRALCLVLYSRHCSTWAVPAPSALSVLASPLAATLAVLYALGWDWWQADRARDGQGGDEDRTPAALALSGPGGRSVVHYPVFPADRSHKSGQGRASTVVDSSSSSSRHCSVVITTHHQLHSWCRNA